MTPEVYPMPAKNKSVSRPRAAMIAAVANRAAFSATEPPLITKRELAKDIGVGCRTIEAWVADRKIPLSAWAIERCDFVWTMCAGLYGYIGPSRRCNKHVARRGDRRRTATLGAVLSLEPSNCRAVQRQDLAGQCVDTGRRRSVHRHICLRLPRAADQLVVGFQGRPEVRESPRKERPGRSPEAHAKLFDRHPTPAVVAVNSSLWRSFF